MPDTSAFFGRNPLVSAPVVTAAAAAVFWLGPFTRPYILKDLLVSVIAGTAAATGAITVARQAQGASLVTLLTLGTVTPGANDGRPARVSLVDATNNPGGGPFRIAGFATANADPSLPASEQDSYMIKVSQATAGSATQIIAADGNFV